VKIRGRIEEIRAEIEALKKEDPVDEEAIAKLKEEEKALNDELRVKRDALNKSIERIKLVAEYGEAAVAEIEKARQILRRKKVK